MPCPAINLRLSLRRCSLLTISKPLAAAAAAIASARGSPFVARNIRQFTYIQYTRAHTHTQRHAGSPGLLWQGVCGQNKVRAHIPVKRGDTAVGSDRGVASKGDKGGSEQGRQRKG